MKRIVLFSERFGVYVGSSLGIGIWKSLDLVTNCEKIITFLSNEDLSSKMSYIEEEVSKIEVDTVDSHFTNLEFVLNGMVDFYLRKIEINGMEKDVKDVQRKEVCVFV